MNEKIEKFFIKITSLLKDNKKLLALQKVIKKTGMEPDEARLLLKSLEEGKKPMLVIDKKKLKKKRIIKAQYILERQKKLRNDFISHLSNDLAKEFKKAESIFFPETEKIITKFQNTIKKHFKKNKVVSTSKKSYKNMAWAEEILKEQKLFGKIFDDVEGYYYPFYPGSTPPYLLQYLNPVYKIKFKTLRQNFEELWKLGNQRFAFFSEDLKKGYYANHYVGYLGSSYNPDETVYEIFMWDDAYSFPKASSKK